MKQFKAIKHMILMIHKLLFTDITPTQNKKSENTLSLDVEKYFKKKQKLWNESVQFAKDLLSSKSKPQ